MATASIPGSRSLIPGYGTRSETRDSMATASIPGFARAEPGLIPGYAATRSTAVLAGFAARNAATSSASFAFAALRWRSFTCP